MAQMPLKSTENTGILLELVLGSYPPRKNTKLIVVLHSAPNKLPVDQLLKQNIKLEKKSERRKSRRMF
jgi:hypothetical protein